MLTAGLFAVAPEAPAAAEELAADTGPPVAPTSAPGVPTAVDPPETGPPATTPAPTPLGPDDPPGTAAAVETLPFVPAAASRSPRERRDPHAATA